MKIKAAILTIFISILMFDCYYKTPKSIDRAQNFNYGWKFYLGDVEYAQRKDFDDKNWRHLDLPHDWSIEGETNVTNPSGGDGGFYPTGIGWYRKTFKVPTDLKGQNVSIYFEGIYMNSEVYINGHSLGIQPYGYTSFEYDLTPFLKFGAENVIAVKVDNSQQKNSRWYSGSGIYRNVTLYVVDKIHFKNWGTYITTPKVTEQNATLTVESIIENVSNESREVLLITEIRDQEGTTITESKKHLELSPGNKNEFSETFIIENPRLWSTDNPNLYTAHLFVESGDEKFDHIQKSFGIRSIEFSVENGFVLNDKKVILNGGCVHHDNGILGAAAYNKAEVRKVKLLKEAGFNAVRTSHNPPSEAFLNACDSLGMLVIDEVFDGWRTHKDPTPFDYSIYFDKWWKHDTESMVLRDRNHPSIIMWSIGNEIMERTEPSAVGTAKMLANTIHNLDSSRPVTSAMTTWGQGWEIFDPLMAAHDIAGYNYQLHQAESDHERVPSRIIVNTESYPANAFFIWDLVSTHNFIVGDFVWTAMDYLGESGIGRYYYPGEPDGEHWEANLYPWHGAYCGDIDLTGWRKPISHYRNLLYNDTERLYVAVKEPNPVDGEIKLTLWAVWPTWESWNWPGHEGKDIQVEVYSKYPKVRLYLNKKLVGEKLTTREQEFKTVFTLPFEKGELVAVGIENEKEVERVVLKTAGQPQNIRLTTDTGKINSDGQDLSYVVIEITDEDGLLEPNAVNEVELSISGPGKIVAFGNANLKDSTVYNDKIHKTWKGRALAIIKGEQEEGEIKLEARSSGLKTASLTIISEPLANE
ncbi:sugar-binding domain-containing protein [Aegicerativicinus sediminis]|uniref:sugar-binding domain-containing protein n=1 Tax=Aegicerativicinus sediminis TaxID=2893202 RepID=UPI001E4466E6|nr:sugar-binding domain-containing protein [Aegicerativicinus sediminis]